MKRLIGILGVSALCSACVVTKQTYGPNGQMAVSMNCSGIALSWASCYEKAGALCGARGYDVLAVNGETGAVIVANPQGAFGSAVINRTMMVSCKTGGANGSPPAPPSAQASPPSSATEECRTRVISAGGKAIPKDEQC